MVHKSMVVVELEAAAEEMERVMVKEYTVGGEGMG